LRTFFTPKSIDPDYKYSSSGVYRAPVAEDLPSFLEYIDRLPFADAPEIFGMHDNANTAFLQQEGGSLLATVLDVQPRLVGSGEGKSPDDIVFELADQILARLPKTTFDLDLAKEGTFALDAKGRVASLSTVLRQEIARFNGLLNTLWRTLADVKKAIKGLVVMSAELEKMHMALINNRVPEIWSSAAYPSLKPLGAWVADLCLRLDFMRGWMLNGAPPSFWVSGLFFPQGFLTGALQTHARKYNLPIDTLSFEFKVINISADQAQGLDGLPLPAVADGVLMHGLFMDACRWDDKLNCMVDSRLGEMQAALPVVHMVPRQHFTPPKTDYIAPLYKTSKRFGVLSTTGHSTNFVVAVHLPSREPQDYWIAKGAALLTQLDA
jgi:dynein heavy chain